MKKTNTLEVIPSLNDAVKEINSIWEKHKERTQHHAVDLIRAGELLAGAKASIKPGEYTLWRESNFEFSRQWADLCVKAWKSRDLLLADSGKSSIYKLLANGEKVDNHRSLGTGENEWFTPIEYVEAARKFLGCIDLDPATHEKAQESVKAKRFFTKEQDGLKQLWQGKVWLNPPYAQPEIQHFAEKMVAEFSAGRVTEAVMLTHNYTDTAWFHKAESACSAICFTRGRIRFLSPEGDAAAPTQGQAFFYFGLRRQQFKTAFKQFGFVR